MALKRRNKVEATFSMSSMTDLIFLLLVFFVIASTMSSPNDLKINLPQSSSKTQTKDVAAKVSIDADGNYFLAVGKEEAKPLKLSEIEQRLTALTQTGDTIVKYVSLHADESTEFSFIVPVLDMARKNKLNMVVATKPEK